MRRGVRWDHRVEESWMLDLGALPNLVRWRVSPDPLAPEILEYIKWLTSVRLLRRIDSTNRSECQCPDRFSGHLT